MGLAYGVLNGISMRPDVPEEVREKCSELVKKYRDEYDGKGKGYETQANP